jgi:hypothetical protein
MISCRRKQTQENKSNQIVQNRLIISFVNKKKKEKKNQQQTFGQTYQMIGMYSILFVFDDF